MPGLQVRCFSWHPPRPPGTHAHAACRSPRHRPTRGTSSLRRRRRPLPQVGRCPPWQADGRAGSCPRRASCLQPLGHHRHAAARGSAAAAGRPGPRVQVRCGTPPALHERAHRLAVVGVGGVGLGAKGQDGHLGRTRYLAAHMPACFMPRCNPVQIPRMDQCNRRLIHAYLPPPRLRALPLLHISDDVVSEPWAVGAGEPGGLPRIVVISGSGLGRKRRPPGGGSVRQQRAYSHSLSGDMVRGRTGSQGWGRRRSGGEQGGRAHVPPKHGNAYGRAGCGIGVGAVPCS